MKEDLLHFVWKNKRFDFSTLKTTQGEHIQVLHFGTANIDAGPDFQNAYIRIGSIYWVGHIEIHVKSSDWISHKHHYDPQYNNVILHVVWFEDVIIKNYKGDRIPCLELKNRVGSDINKVYEKIILSGDWIPCAPQWNKMNPELKRSCIRKKGIEILANRQEKIRTFHLKQNLHWEQLLFILLAESFGRRTNKDAFRALAQSVPVSKLLRHSNDRFQIEAMLFGQAGFLSEKYNDKYPSKLYSEYNFLKHKYKMQSIPKTYWKFSRMRPANFPTIRISQLSGIYALPGPKFQMLLDFPLEKIYSYFQSIYTSIYWKSHYLFDKESIFVEKPLGKTRIQIIIINTIVPLLYYYGKEMKKKDLVEKAIGMLQQISPENNQIVRSWIKLGSKPENALTTQGLIHLKKNYCDHKKCLSCELGHSLLKNA